MAPSPEQRQQLKAVRDILLPLHKVLLDRERGVYEKENEAVTSPGQFLQLVIGHAQFEWLRQLSGMIVQIDEILAPRSKATAEDGESALGELRELLKESAAPGDFQKNYWQAIQEEPDVLIAHVKLERLIG